MLALFLAGIGAGTVNTIVGSGSLITFPALLAFGYPPVLANVTNNIGVLPGSLSGVVGYRRELVGQLPRVLRLGSASLVGAAIGALLLLRLPESTFQAVVPALILVACVLVVIGPRLSRWLVARRRPAAHGGPTLLVLVLLTGVYGGYFGAAQGVILIAVLAIMLQDDLQRLNAVKNVLAALANAVAAVVFVLVTEVAWGPALVIAAGSVLGGQLGAAVGRRVPSNVYRAVVLVVGLTAAGAMVTG